ncbi:MAG: hemerythrin domain-containing protein [Rhodospirillales bacterium]|nr:hemerythrin domain-containing protein [Rhodospirillales bacterium]
MRIPVKLISVDGPPPPGFDDAGDGSIEAADGASLADVLAKLGLAADEAYATLVNGEPVAAAERRRRRLKAGDSLTVFPPIKGGALDRGQRPAGDSRLESPITPPLTGGHPMPKILDDLHDDHMNMARLYDLLGRELMTFKNGELPDYELVQKILDYCLAYPDQVHHPKEDLVFRKLKARDPAAAESIGDLAEEHEKLAAFTRRFATALANVLEDEQLPRDWFVDLANDFLAFSRRHMQMEEVLLFPAARKLLTPADWAEIEKAMVRRFARPSDDDRRERFEAGLGEIMAWGKAAESETPVVPPAESPAP